MAMKRAALDEDRSIQEISAKHQKLQQQKLLAGSLNLKSVCTTSLSNELGSTFVLQSIGDHIILRSKCDITIMKIKKHPGSHQSKFQLTSESFPCSQYNLVDSKQIDKKNVFIKASLEEKCALMLDPNLLPDCLPATTQLLKCQPSPYSTENAIFIASLTSRGSLSLSKFASGGETISTNQSDVVELCEVRKKSYAMSSLTKFDKLQQTFRDLAFFNFDWCPQLICDTSMIATLTKSREIFIYGIEKNGSVTLQLSQKLKDSSVNNVKWVVNGEQHYLITMNQKGNWCKNLIRFKKGRVESMEQEGEVVQGNLKTSISHMDVLSLNDTLFLLCVKAHSLEIFPFNGGDSIIKYVGLNITGVTSICSSKPHYLISALNNEIFYMELMVDEAGLKIDQFEKVETSSSTDLRPSKFGVYGIAASKNKVLTFIAMLPQVTSDHLTLKQPLNVSVNLFSLNSAHKLLIDNHSLKLTDYVDCVEAVRFMGAGKLETLQPLELMNYDIALDDKFLYYLKLQLIVIESKIVFYQIRSDKILELMKSNELSLQQVIGVINGYMNLKRLKAAKNNVKAIPALVTFIQTYLKAKISNEPFKTAQKTFNLPLQALLEDFSQAQKKFDEKCEFCMQPVEQTTMTCIQNHPVNRCIITKLPQPITAKNCCASCKVTIADAQTLREVTGESESLCLYCDGHFTFN